MTLRLNLGPYSYHSLMIFGVLAGFSSNIKYSYDLLSSFPEDMNSREGYTVISDAFSPGDLAPTTIIVDSDGQDDLNLTENIR